MVIKQQWEKTENQVVGPILNQCVNNANGGEGRLEECVLGLAGA